MEGRLVLALGLVLAATPAAAQQITLEAGYTRMPGRIGSSRSDQGALLRAGIHTALGSHVLLGVEGAVERLNQHYQESSTTCFLPGGGTGPCFFRLWERDVGWSLGAVLRVMPRRAAVTPYLLIGAGYLSVRQHSRQEAEDAAGNPLPNFVYDASFGDAALQAHAGAGVELRPAGSPLGFSAEFRATRLVHNYSGGIQADWNPNVALGLRWQP